jgi:hypothetical protein
MTAFTIKSTKSDLKLVLSDIEGDYFTARLESSYLNAILRVYSYHYSSNAEGFAGFMERLGEENIPWEESKNWESLEGEFKVSAVCSPLGVVTFEVNFRYFDGAENWEAKTSLMSELGLLPGLAKSAKTFFGESK